MHGGWRRLMWRDSRGAMSSPASGAGPATVLARYARNDRLADAVHRGRPARSAPRLARAYYDLSSATIWP
jgi:hypothetical protein